MLYNNDVNSNRRAVSLCVFNINNPAVGDGASACKLAGSVLGRLRAHLLLPFHVPPPPPRNNSSSGCARASGIS